MKIIITLLRLLSAVCMLAFAGAVVGGCAGLMLAGFDLLAFHHISWPMEAGAVLLVAWGFIANGDGAEVEPPEPRKPRPKACSIDLFDDDDEPLWIGRHPGYGIRHY